ncbi:MAG: hypothetical protein KGJ59_04745 [Bacteroidota bacterium]|nr:hypothetical protein [Bacteroidota bacterium]
MTHRLIVCAVMIVFALTYSANGQEQQIKELKNSNPDSSRVITNAALGFSFAKIGQVTASDSSGYSLILGDSLSESAPKSVAHISTADELFIDLPGSFGGRLYYGSPDMKSLAASRLVSDSLSNGAVKFRREYWAVYAGMGAWEEVVNCYTRQNGHYYVISLTRDRALGKPGMQAEGKQLTAEELQAKAVASLRDTTDAAIKQFNELLASFRIEK